MTANRRYAVASFDLYTDELTQVIVSSGDVKSALLLAAPHIFATSSEEAKAELTTWLKELLDSTSSMELICNELYNSCEKVINILEILQCQ